MTPTGNCTFKAHEWKGNTIVTAKPCICGALTVLPTKHYEELLLKLKELDDRIESLESQLEQRGQRGIDWE
jgi:hypothetical protein